MRPLILFFAFFVFASFCFGQKKNKEEFFLFDKDGKNITEVAKTSYFIRVRYVNDTSWKMDTYRWGGPMINSETCKDREGQIRHGEYISYKKSGMIDSIGQYINGRMVGDWNYCNDTGKVVIQKTFDNDVLVKTRDILKEEKEKKKETASDSIKRDEKESEFKGGIRAWSSYLTKNLRYPELAIKTNTTGKVIVNFIVGTDGSVHDIHLFKSVEYSLDDEAVRMIKESPKWEPAYQDGRKVKSYKRQPIIFALSGG